MATKTLEDNEVKGDSTSTEPSTLYTTNLNHKLGELCKELEAHILYLENEKFATDSRAIQLEANLKILREKSLLLDKEIANLRALKSKYDKESI